MILLEFMNQFFTNSKVPTLTMQISEFNNKNDLDNYWNSFENKKKKIFDSAYLQEIQMKVLNVCLIILQKVH